MSDSFGANPNRRGFLKTAAISAAGAYLLAAERPVAAVAGPSYFPAFSWDRVPVAADVGKVTGNFNAGEIDFLSKNYAFLSIEKSQATGLQPKGSEQTEIGFEVAARALKAANPNTKILFYWSGGAFHSNYASAKSFDMSWGRSRPGSQIVAFDITNPAFRNWWVDSAATIVDTPLADGIFVDGFNNFRYDPNKEAMLRAFRDHVTAQGKSPIILYNGLPQSPSDPASFFDVADGLMYEQFDVGKATGQDQVRSDMLALQAIGKAGKIVMFRGFPGFTLSDPIVRTSPYSDLVAMARKNIVFPLACYLCVAGQYSYLQYSWGYSNLGGVYILQADQQTVDPAWYPELLRPLGPPKGDAAVNGYVFTRSFEHADVRVDVAAHTASINWH
jgi:Hypothetical glycosyl hydrolase family 15